MSTNTENDCNIVKAQQEGWDIMLEYAPDWCKMFEIYEDYNNDNYVIKKNIVDLIKSNTDKFPMFVTNLHTIIQYEFHQLINKDIWYPILDDLKIWNKKSIIWKQIYILCSVTGSMENRMKFNRIQIIDKIETIYNSANDTDKNKFIKTVKTELGFSMMDEERFISYFDSQKENIFVLIYDCIYKLGIQISNTNSYIFYKFCEYITNNTTSGSKATTGDSNTTDDGSSNGGSNGGSETGTDTSGTSGSNTTGGKEMSNVIIRF